MLVLIRERDGGLLAGRMASVHGQAEALTFASPSATPRVEPEPASTGNALAMRVTIEELTQHPLCSYDGSRGWDLARRLHALPNVYADETHQYAAVIRKDENHGMRVGVALVHIDLKGQPTQPIVATMLVPDELEGEKIVTAACTPLGDAVILDDFAWMISSGELRILYEWVAAKDVRCNAAYSLRDAARNLHKESHE